MTFWEYQSGILSNLVRNGKLINNIRSLKFQPEGADRGVIRSVTPLAFKDGSVLTVLEIIRIREDTVTRTEYSYEYRRPDGYYFRYDRDTKHYKPVIHELCHLHVCKAFPRLPTHDTNLEEILNFVIACFYST